MIVAACTLQVDPGSRSRSVASVIETIACACAHQPAPDLVVLPNCYVDVPGGPATPQVSPAMCIAFRETVARAAREWGVWIAAGHARIMPSGILPGASVFDPDGDAWLRYPVQHATNNGNGASANQWSIRPTPMGRWGLRTAANLDYGDLAFGDKRPDLAIVPTAPGVTPPSLDELSNAAATMQCAICVARAQLDGESLRTTTDGNALIVARDGELLASAPAGVVIAEIELPACAEEPLLEDIEQGE